MTMQKIMQDVLSGRARFDPRKSMRPLGKTRFAHLVKKGLDEAGIDYRSRTPMPGVTCIEILDKNDAQR